MVFIKEIIGTMKVVKLDKTGTKWSREETILAFDLYCRTPFGKISSTNNDIKELAQLIGRTSGAVALKMHNLAHFDPELRKRNITAMAHGSKLDLEVWNEFCENWEELSFAARCILAELKSESIDKIIEPELQVLPDGDVRNQLIKARIGQYFFRMAVLNSYENKCCITGMPYSELLVASHIKPWKDSDPKAERTNPMNGLSLNALHDKAFDKGLMTITPDYTIHISSKLKREPINNSVYEWIVKYEKQRILLPNKFIPKREFLEYHNDVIFLG